MNAINYSQINAKIKAMKGKLLKKQDYLMLAQSKTVEELGHKLKAYGSYTEVMAELEKSDLRRALIEQKIVLTLIADCKKIYQFIGNFDARAYLEAFFLQYDLDRIQFLLCTVYDKQDLPYSQAELAELFIHKLDVNWPKLIASKTVSEFIGNLQNTLFYPLLSKYEGQETVTLFDLGMKLDLYYYIHIWKMQNKHLDKKNRSTMSNINGTEIDLQNIQWIYRLKNFYNMKEQQIYGFLIPIRHLLSQEKVAKLVESKTEDDFWHEIETSPYAHALKKEQTIEMGFHTAMNHLFIKSRIEHPQTLATTIAYIHAKHLEIRNIVSLMEGVRYSLQQNEIMSHLIVH